MKTESGKLYLIPCTLGDSPPLDVLPAMVEKVIERLDFFVVEHEKSARHFIKSIVPQKPQSELRFQLINKFTDEAEIPGMLLPCLEGVDLGVISDAGCPGIADPGASVVRQAHIQGIRVIPLVGPSSILLAMMASGFNGQNFSFNGYLPIEKSERKSEIKRLERISGEYNQSQLFIETPYRNNQLLETLLSVLNDQTSLCVACDLTLSSEYIKTATVSEWKKIKVDLHKRPTLFILHKQ